MLFFSIFQIVFSASAKEATASWSDAQTQECITGMTLVLALEESNTLERSNRHFSDSIYFVNDSLKRCIVDFGSLWHESPSFYQTDMAATQGASPLLGSKSLS